MTAKVSKHTHVVGMNTLAKRLSQTHNNRRDTVLSGIRSTQAFDKTLGLGIAVANDHGVQFTKVILSSHTFDLAVNLHGREEQHLLRIYRASVPQYSLPAMNNLHNRRGRSLEEALA